MKIPYAPIKVEVLLLLGILRNKGVIVDRCKVDIKYVRTHSYFCVQCFDAFLTELSK